MEAELDPGELLSLWCAAIFDSWIQRGLEEVVLCPGSRNAPLIEEALRRPELRCHSVIDERSAAFFALGLARISERPTVVCCTSGSALGHFMPAVMEAHHADVPLIVLSADRPDQLQGCGAPQTLQQPGALAPFALCEHAWLEPSQDPRIWRRWLQTLARTWSSASDRPGPVHLNVPLAKPLEPKSPSTEVELAFRERLRGEEGQSFLPEGPTVDVSSLPRQVDLLSVGPCSTEAQRAAARAAGQWGCPILCEYPLLADACLPGPVAQWLDAQPSPIRWLHVGHPQVQSKWGLLQQRPDVELWVASGALAREPLRVGRLISAAPLTAQLAALADEILGRQGTHASPGVDGWMPSKASREKVEAALAETPERDACGWTEPRALLALLLRASFEVREIVLGNSLLLRTVARLSPLLKPGPQYHFSRGVNGIDGGIAHACGAAMAAGLPTLGLLGDVAALHDAGSLALARMVGVPLILAIVDNEGGRIFDFLPVAKDWDRRPRLMDHLRTPTPFDWRSWTSAYGVAYEVAESEASLQLAWTRSLERKGVTVLHLRVSAELTPEFYRSVARGEPVGWGDAL